VQKHGLHVILFYATTEEKQCERKKRRRIRKSARLWWTGTYYAFRKISTDSNPDPSSFRFNA